MNEIGEFIFSKFGSWVNDRVYPDYAPKGSATPCLIYQLIGEDFEEMLEPSLDDALTIQFRIYTTQATGGRAAASIFRRHIKQQLDSICRLSLKDTASDKVTIDGSFVDGFVDDHDEETETYGAICIWKVTTSVLRAAIALTTEAGEALTDQSGSILLTEPQL